MNTRESFKKNEYKKRCKDYNSIVYDLAKKEEYEILPDTIIIKNDIVIFSTDNIDEHTFKGTFEFGLNKELLQAILQTMEERKK